MSQPQQPKTVSVWKMFCFIRESLISIGKVVEIWLPASISLYASRNKLEGEGEA
jgi:hypothetical protein